MCLSPSGKLRRILRLIGRLQVLLIHDFHCRMWDEKFANAITQGTKRAKEREKWGDALGRAMCLSIQGMLSIVRCPPNLSLDNAACYHGLCCGTWHMMACWQGRAYISVSRGHST